MPPYMPPQPLKTNGMAIASLVCGLLGCIPWFITGLLAIVFGIIGLGKAKQPQTGGKGLALAGLILGILSIFWSGGFIVSSLWLYHKGQAMLIQPARAATSGFVNSLAAGDTDKARTYTTGTLEQSDFSALSQQIKSYGKFKDFSLSGFEATPSNGAMNLTIRGTATFDNATKGFKASLLGDPKTGGGFKISELSIE
jgi:hypothetical protein